MFVAANHHLFLKTLSCIEVTYKESRAFALQCTYKKFQRTRYVGFPTLWLKIEHFMYDIQYMFSSFFRRNILFYLIRKEYNSYFIIILYCTESKRGRNFGDHITLYFRTGSKIKRPTNINKQHDCKLSFFLKNLYMWIASSCSNIPIYVTHIISVLICTYFTECHSTPFKCRMVFSCKNITA